MRLLTFCWPVLAGPEPLISVARAEDPPDETPDLLLENLEFGGSIELAYEHEGDFDLDAGEKDDLDLLAAELTLEFRLLASDYLEIYFQPQVIQQVPPERRG